MPKTNPETERLAEAFRREMGGQKISIRALADAITEQQDPDADPVSEMWASRRVNGVSVLYEPPRPARLSPDVERIRAALGINRAELAQVLGITEDEYLALISDYGQKPVPTKTR